MPSPASPIILLLRFRDLSSPIPGHTIQQHSLVIEANGYAWWAWWKKQSEDIPVQLWSDLLRQIARTGPAPVFLVDSGQRRLYRTTLQGIDFDPAGNLKEAPEGGSKTPAYYQSSGSVTRFATWFKIGPISEAQERELNELMYRAAPHDDLVDARGEEFVARRIAGISELLQFGNVTYWVATPATADAKPARSEPISVKIIPPVAPKDIVRAESNRILHLSDLHVAPGKHAFAVGSSDAHNVSLADALIRALKGERLPGLVIVTGDLSWIGSQAEFDGVFACLDSIRSTLGLTRQQFVLIPGNHDLQWTQAQRDGAEYDWTGKVEMAGPAARHNYETFFARWYGVAANKWLSIGRRFFLVGGPSLDVLGLNSSALQQIEGHFAGLGRITEQAFEESADEMGWSGPRATAVRFLAVHHHLLPVLVKEAPEEAKRGFGIALDAGNQLLKAVRYGVDLVLHGHQHHPYAGFTHREEIVGEPIRAKKGLLVLGGGSASVINRYLGPINQRSFNLIHLGFEETKVELFSTYDAPDEFKKISELVVRLGEPWRRS